MICYIGVGSNLGDRREHIRKVLVHLKKVKGVGIRKSSAIYETQAVGGPKGQADHYNLVLEIATDLDPRALFRELKDIEEKMGRKGPYERWAARQIDLDILCCDDIVLEQKDLEIPHPRMHERFFVLKPLSELAPRWRHPQLGLDVVTMLKALKTEGRWKKIEETL